MIRVWFNHWFSTAYGIIQLMKDDSEEQVYVIGTSCQADSVVQKVCDEWYEEPDTCGEEYIKFCLKFCKEQKIDVFVPYRNMIDISKNKERFTSVGIKVMVDNNKIIDFLDNKAATYEHFRNYENVNIPDYYTVKTAEEFAEAHDALLKKYSQVCVKFVRDKGGMSFRRIIENVDEFDQLRTYQSAKMSYNDLYHALSTKEEFDELMIMPYLSGDEVSVDCLRTGTGTIAIPRIKSSTRAERVVFDDEILSVTANVLTKINLKYPCNVQFRYMDGKLYLLEINPRMSGGLQMTCMAAGVNIPNIALNKILGKDLPWSIDEEEKTVSYVEIPQIIK